VSFAVLAASHALLFNDALHSFDLLRGCFTVALVGGIAELVSGEVLLCIAPGSVAHPHFVFWRSQTPPPPLQDVTIGLEWMTIL
jgi:hypothetical protein